MKTNNDSQLHILIAVVCLCFLFFVFKCNRSIQLKNNYLVSNGRIVKVSVGGTGGGLQFTFPEFKGKYNPVMGLGSPRCESLVKDQLSNLRKERFPVVYSSKNLSNAKILIFREQYEKFDIEIPPDLIKVVDNLSTCKN